MKTIKVLTVALLLTTGHAFAQDLNVEALQAQLEQQKEELQKLKDTMQSSQRELEVVQDKIKSSEYESIQLNEKIEELCDQLEGTSVGALSNPVCAK